MMMFNVKETDPVTFTHVSDSVSGDIMECARRGCKRGQNESIAIKY